MGLGYWIDFIIVLSLGIILVQISHGKLLDTTKFNIKFSLNFLKVIRYMGLFIIIYSCYGIIIDYVVNN